MASSETLEVERKYEAAEDDELPALDALAGVDRVGPPEEESLEAVYFDTAGLALASRRITLRRRTGGHDAGWHLKLPVAAGERREISAPLGKKPESVPRRLLQLVRVHTRDHDLIPVARLKTRRTVRRLFAADGRTLAEFSDDRVDSLNLLEPPAHATWREWELELNDGPKGLLKSADALVAATGRHEPSAFPSKLARSLGGMYPPDRTAVPDPDPRGPASAVLLSYLHQQVEALKKHDPGVRTAAVDAVHQLRVAARRIRSALATFQKFADGSAARSLRSDLQWLASTVGESRDNEVISSRLMELVGAEPAELVMGQVTQQIEDHLGVVAKSARAKASTAMNSARYFRLLDALDDFLANPPLTETAGGEALPTVGRLLSKERKKLKKQVAALDLDTVDQALDLELHDVRKRAKRLRYAAEASAPVFGKRATALARAAEEIQEILGEHHDSVVTRDLLRRLATDNPGANAFTYGRLHALEQQTGDESRKRFFRTWRTSAPRPLRWK
ncbi:MULTISPECIES: CYTH and CHAD domain-containing protein [unclassified Arthrobacter]|uniref:CYTH and CHAD domain-containing protein n=1 Tax=unclassified Arthrobacter TaxID=235627 RepID=UPI002DFB4D66|nr:MULTISPECIES: CYTH and CHAD domain-containing protein [unclassified Arthrobacter]MEC5190869.1 CHAD domain-containing protein [Arthrobacter sp. MP_M4]MEC5202113.1 CHAD domain-containing protein [Arthrobacter sp. MP_M7]